MSLEIKPGERLLDNELATSLGFGRTPVREALLMLESEKLVVCSNSSGFAARRFTARDVEEYFEARRAIEDFVISLVIARITEEEITLLKENVAQAEKMAKEGNIKGSLRIETEFHELLYRAAKSEVLFELISTFVSKFQLFRAITINAHNAAARSASQHRNILLAIEGKDEKRLRKLMRSHLIEAEQTITGIPSLLL